MGKRLIVADDNPVYRDALKSLLEFSGFEIIAEAGNGLEAIEKAEKLNPDLLLLDISMPKLDGMEVLKELRVRYPDLKIIMLTMYKHLLNQALELGANGYCTKECSPKDLLAGIEKVFKGDICICTE